MWLSSFLVEARFPMLTRCASALTFFILGRLLLWQDGEARARPESSFAGAFFNL